MARRFRQLLGQSSMNGASGSGALRDGTPKSQTMVAGDGLRFFHRADCPMAVGREWAAAPPDEHTKAGRVPCGMCRP